MGAYITQQIVLALIEKDIPKFLAYILIFFLLWREIRGIRKEMHAFSELVAKSFKEGTERMNNLDKANLNFEHRLIMLETKPKGDRHHEDNRKV